MLNFMFLATAKLVPNKTTGELFTLITPIAGKYPLGKLALDMERAGAEGIVPGKSYILSMTENVDYVHKDPTNNERYFITSNLGVVGALDIVDTVGKLGELKGITIPAKTQASTPAVAPIILGEPEGVPAPKVEEPLA